jgi:hypothetical protein
MKRERRGRVALFRDENVDVEVLKIGNRCIVVYIRLRQNEIKWRCTFVYGEPKARQRFNMWELLQRIKPLAAGPWLMAGDFNECLWQGEHYSKRKRNEKQMYDFGEILSHCDLRDLRYTGLPWTYDNKHKGANNVRVRLDREWPVLDG